MRASWQLSRSRKGSLDHKLQLRFTIILGAGSTPCHHTLKLMSVPWDPSVSCCRKRKISHLQAEVTGNLSRPAWWNPARLRSTGPFQDGPSSSAALERSTGTYWRRRAPSQLAITVRKARCDAICRYPVCRSIAAGTVVRHVVKTCRFRDWTTCEQAIERSGSAGAKSRSRTCWKGAVSQ